MRHLMPIASIVAALVSACSPPPQLAEAHQDMQQTACVPANGRQGQPGCWIISTLPVAATAGNALYWHVYELAAGSEPVVADLAGGRLAQAYGRNWLFMMGDRDWRPNVGQHVATVGPMLPLTSGPHTASFAAAMFTPGMRSRTHTHPGPEGWVVLEGEQCLETPEGIIRVGTGESMMVRGGIPMALFGTGTGTRRALVVVLHPADQPWGMTHTGWQPKGACLAS